MRRRSEGSSPSSRERAMTARTSLARPSVCNAPERSSGQLMVPSATAPRRSSRIRTSSSAPDIRRGNSSPGSRAAVMAKRPNANEWKVATCGRSPPPSRDASRSRSSPAARRPKVIARTAEAGSGSDGSWSRAATASTIVVVLPVPGPARTSSGPERWSTTWDCS